MSSSQNLKHGSVCYQQLSDRIKSFGAIRFCVPTFGHVLR